MQTKVINLFGAPGVGKSTIASYIFAELKAKKFNCELVTEFAKDLCWDKNLDALNNQYYVFGVQSYRLSHLIGKVDIIICDSPLPLAIIYAKEHISKHFTNVVLDDFFRYDNYNYLLLNSNQDFNSAGRIHSKAEAAKLQINIQNMLNAKAINYITVAYYNALDAASLIIHNFLRRQNIFKVRSAESADEKIKSWVI